MQLSVCSGNNKVFKTLCCTFTINLYSMFWLGSNNFGIYPLIYQQCTMLSSSNCSVELYVFFITEWMMYTAATAKTFKLWYLD